jgi:hypothetical protein
LQNSPLESSCVIVALIENYGTSKPLTVSPEKSQILSCDIVVTLLYQMSNMFLSSEVLASGLCASYMFAQ